jgi:hypothetical protein
MAAAGFAIIAVLCAMYFLPTIVAFARDHSQKAAIFLLNFLLGWSVIGWVVAIVWAVTNSTPQTVIINQVQPPPT